MEKRGEEKRRHSGTGTGEMPAGILCADIAASMSVGTFIV